MTPLTKDCYGIQRANGRIYLADVFSVICKQSSSINISIIKDKMNLCTQTLEDVLIVPNLERRLFSANLNLNKGNKWFHFEKTTFYLEST